MSSGFSGGGPDFYAALPGRSMNVVVNNGNTSQPSYHHQRMQPGIFMDTSSSSSAASQITNRVAPNLIGKRAFNDFHTPPPQQVQPQFQQLQQQNQAFNNLFLRSVKPRTCQNLSSISPLPPVDLYNSLPNRYALQNPVLQQQQQQQQQLLQQQQLRPQQQLQLRPQQQQQQQQQQQNQQDGFISASVNQINPYLNKQVIQVAGQDSEKKMLKELEKQLLDDNDDDDGDAVSVITSMNSEWSETIQNLMSPSPKPVSPISPSPTTSSSSSSSSVASPATTCSKQTVREAATAISEARNDIAAEILNRLSQASSSKGNSEQRLMEYMGLALKSKMNMVENPAPVAELFTQQHSESTQSLYDLSPCFKLGFMAANLAILDATVGCKNFHVVDFDIGQSGQYMNLLHALGSRQNGKPSVVSITAVADNGGGEERLNAVGDVLRKVAERVGVCLNFKVVSLFKLGDLSRGSLGCDADEPLVVNFAFKLFKMPDESVSTENPRDDLLRRVKALSPRVVTLVEQEMNTNTAPFLHRVGEAWGYYGALLDSIESASRDHPDRVKVEEGLGRKLANSVACEGRERVERCEVFGKWRARLSMAGFQLKPMSHTIAESLRARLSSSNRVNPGFTVKDENGGVCFGWMGRTLTVASAWR